MARKPNPAPENRLVPMNEALMKQDVDAASALALQRQDAALQLAQTLDYQGSLEPGVLENGARAAIRRIGMGIFELGGYLLLLKEVSSHGDFIPALDRLGINRKSAHKYMSVTQRFANVSTTRHLEQIGFAKMAELLPLDDSQLDDLIGEDGRLDLDAVDRMSVRELRAEVRRQKEKAQRLEDVSTELNRELVNARAVIGHASADARLRMMQDELAARGRTALVYVRGELRMAMVALMEREESAPSDATAPREPSHRHLMAGWLDEIEQTIEELREEFGLRYIRKEQRELLYGVKDGEPMVTGGDAAAQA